MKAARPGLIVVCMILASCETHYVERYIDHPGYDNPPPAYRPASAPPPSYEAPSSPATGGEVAEPAPDPVPAGTTAPTIPRGHAVVDGEDVEPVSPPVY